MTIPYRTCALLGLTVALVSAGYFFAPSPAATSPFAAPALAKAGAVPSETRTVVVQPDARPIVKVDGAKAVSTKSVGIKPAGIVTARAPVPLVPLRHNTFVTVPSGDAREAPELMQGQTQALTMGTEDESQARRAIEFDGYRNVRGLVKAPDGGWHGRAMRGATEITVRVAADGSVSAD